jgi:hypothetical protein
MPDSAAYVAIQDGSTTLDHGDDIDHTFGRFDAPSVNPNRRPVLSFRLNPNIGEGAVSLEMTLNDVVIVEQTFTTNEARGWQEVVESNLLREEDNELTARLTDSDDAGGITLSDISLLYMNVA